MVDVNKIQAIYPVNEVLFRIARSKHSNYALNSTDIKIDNHGRAVLSETADPESWNYCLVEVPGGRFTNDDKQILCLESKRDTALQCCEISSVSANTWCFVG